MPTVDKELQRLLIIGAERQSVSKYLPKDLTGMEYSEFLEFMDLQMIDSEDKNFCWTCIYT